ncbi:MAG TPA: hypothetical protein VJ892_02360 [Candidatus Absconditabacterales bacterium]|nr:hypothetical protein [Candidatus Absconditabacterales bacterium]
MTYLEYLQIKNSIEQEKQKDRLTMVIWGIMAISISLALYISLDWIIIPIMILAWGVFSILTTYILDIPHKKRITKLKELYKKGVNAETAARIVFGIK